MKIIKKIPTNIYKNICGLIPIVCVDLVIRCRKKFLLGFRKNKPAKNKWWFIGGRIFKGETLKQAVIRKAKEEAGIHIDNMKLMGTEETMFRNGPFNSPTHTINIIYLIKIKPNKLIKDGQHTQLCWFSKINKNWPKYIKKYLALTEF